MANRKSLDLIVLLVISMLVVTASAAIYNHMYLEGSPIGAEAPFVKFVSGSDAASALGTNDTYVKITDMAGWPNATRVYEEAVKIESLDSNDRTVELAFDSWSGNTANITYIYVKVFDGSTQKGSTLSVAAGNSTGTFILTGLATYRVQWEIKWDGGAVSTYSVDVMLKLIVTGA
jgi:hypothetical protein